MRHLEKRVEKGERNPMMEVLEQKRIKENMERSDKEKKLLRHITRIVMDGSIKDRSCPIKFVYRLKKELELPYINLQ